ncbi:MAG TPA: hypothetical protein ENN21_07865 [Spirochaetes bacterium]|nr:hypothetical protein [Spirochaetota bacterium]
MRKSYLLFALMSVLLILPFMGDPGSYAQVAPVRNSWLNGFWAGTGFQLSDGSTWNIRLNCSSSRNEYLIEYPSLGCGGKWILLTSDAHMAKFTETITRGLESCMNGGLIIITRIDKNHITYSYFSNPGKALEAYSTLRRIKEQ